MGDEIGVRGGKIENDGNHILKGDGTISKELKLKLKLLGNWENIWPKFFQ